jgi:hypothetical protein
MGIHARLIWPHLIVLTFVGPGCDGWQSQSRPISPSGPAVAEAATQTVAGSHSQGFNRVSTEQDGRRTIAITAIGGETEPPRLSKGPMARTGSSYFVSPNPRSGSGTIAHPFGLADLLNPDHSPGRALTALQPGDTLFFEAGDYHLTGSSDPTNAWSTQLLSPSVSGTATQPITLKASPGATVRIFEDTGLQPVFGTTTPTLNYVRFIGFTVHPGPNAAFHLGGTGDEVAYCEVVGQYVATTDNHDGIRIDNANSAWIHNNNVHGVTGDGQNSAGIKVYRSTNLLIADNYIHDCIVGVFDKDGGSLGDGTNQPTYTRNWITNNSIYQFLGNNQGDLALYYIYDNVIDGLLNIYTLNTGSQIHNNLVRTSHMGNGRIVGIGTWMSTYLQNIWNNIIIANRQAVWGYGASAVPFSTGNPKSPLRYMDYNVYDSTPAYLFNDVTYTLAQLRDRGFERHTAVVAGPLSIFHDLTSYQLKPRWTKAGRYGDPVGPRFPIAKIFDTHRYGPSALSTGSRPIITQQPRNKVVSQGSIASFSVQVNGTGLTYQWESSKDGGATWVIIQKANSPVLEIPRPAISDNGAIFRCLVSCSGGSLASEAARLTVNSSTSTMMTRP